MADVDPAKWFLNGEIDDIKLGGGVSGEDYTLDMDSTLALTLTVHDQQRVLITSGVLDANEDGRLDQGLEALVDGAYYRLGSFKKTGDVFTLGMEDRAAARLRDSRGPLKPRDGENHVRFARRLVESIGEVFVTPTGVAVATDGSVAAYKKARAEADDRREKGFADAILGTTKESKLNSGTHSGSAGVGLTPGLRVSGTPSVEAVRIKGKAPTTEQTRNLEIVMGVAAKEQAGQRATIAMLCAGIGESTFRNVVNSIGYGGVFQGDVSHQYRYFKATDTAAMAHSFLRGGKGFQQGGAIALAAANPSMGAGEIATRVEGSWEDPSFYDKYLSEAHVVYNHYFGGIDPSRIILGSDQNDEALPNGLVLKGTSRASALVQRGTPDDPNEDSWTCLQRISKARGWRCFVVHNKVYYAREQDLIRSRPRLTISEQSAGVDVIDWEWSPRKKVNVATVTCRASLWSAPPGSVAVFVESGGANGRWLVSSFKRARESKQATIELRRGTELIQPPKTTAATSPVSQAGAASVKAVCKTISDQHRSYLYGGGHGKKLDDITGSEPLDCSSSVCLALHEAGLFKPDTAWVSGQLASDFGVAGRGKIFTLWASNDHVFLQSETKDDQWRFDTGGPGGGDGPRLRQQWRPTAGFTPRHVSGG